MNLRCTAARTAVSICIIKIQSSHLGWSMTYLVRVSTVKASDTLSRRRNQRASPLWSHINYVTKPSNRRISHVFHLWNGASGKQTVQENLGRWLAEPWQEQSGRASRIDSLPAEPHGHGSAPPVGVKLWDAATFYWPEKEKSLWLCSPPFFTWGDVVHPPCSLRALRACSSLFLQHTHTPSQKKNLLAAVLSVSLKDADWFCDARFSWRPFRLEGV